MDFPSTLLRFDQVGNTSSRKITAVKQSVLCLALGWGDFWPVTIPWYRSGCCSTVINTAKILGVEKRRLQYTINKNVCKGWKQVLYKISPFISGASIFCQPGFGNKVKICSFCLDFCHFSKSFKRWKNHGKGRFQSAFGVQRTQTLVEIYNIFPYFFDKA